MPTRLRALLLVLGLASPALAQPAPDRPFAGHQVHRVTVTTQDQLDAVSKLSGEAYVKTGASPISGLWVAPT